MDEITKWNIIIVIWSLFVYCWGLFVGYLIFRNRPNNKMKGIGN